MNSVTGSSGLMGTSRARITGLSGFDTESMIKQLMTAEKIPLNSLNQKRTLVQWKQESYRDVTNLLRGVKSTFFDVVNRSSYILSSSSVKAMKASSNSSDYLNVTATSDASIGTKTVKVLQVASADSGTSSDPVSKAITGQVKTLDLAGQSVMITLDGDSREIQLATYAEDNIASAMQTEIDRVFGGGKIKVSYDAGTLSINTEGGATKVSVGLPASGSPNGLNGLGLTAGSTNRINMNSTLQELSSKLGTPLTFVNDQVQFSINGKTFSAKKDETLSSLFTRINADTTANVTIAYDEVSDKVTVTSKKLGDGDQLTLADQGTNFLAALNVDSAHAVMSQGQDAKILIDGTQAITRSTNSFTVDGINYTLKNEHPAGSDGDTITIEQDVDTAFNNIKSFVDKYNDLLDKLNGKIDEKYDRDYLPLTDDQKSTMKEADITSWEKKAKTGLLQDDSILRKIVQDMRMAMYEPVDGTNLTLKNLGITSNGYQDKGKLYIDEGKLKDALKNNPDEVVKLLNGVDPGNPAYSRTATSDQRTSRYNKSGIFQRLSDIIEDNTSTLRDNSQPKGLKGILLEKAGMEGDMSYTDNLLDDEIDDFDDRIKTMQDNLNAKEERYYKQFSAMESYLQQMNSQSQWLAQQFSSGQ